MSEFAGSTHLLHSIELTGSNATALVHLIGWVDLVDLVDSARAVVSVWL